MRLIGNQPVGKGWNNMHLSVELMTDDDVMEVARVYLIDGQLKFKITPDIENRGIKKERIQSGLQEMLYDSKHRWYPLEDREKGEITKWEIINGKDNPEKMFNSAHYIINCGRWNFSAPTKDDGD
jgi:hypothetical protein